MTDKHTPGEWKVAGHTVYALCDDNVNRFQAEVSAGFTEYPVRRGGKPVKAKKAEMEANARLIAAAPDMLKALKYLYTNADLTHGDRMVAREAIAKVEGGDMSTTE